MRSTGSLTLIDSASALSFIFVLLIVSFTYVNPSYSTLAMEMEYYQKTAEQILLISATKGDLKKLAEEIENGGELTPILLKMVESCPSELACRLYVSSEGRVLSSFGILHDSTYGEARFFLTLKQSGAVVVCQISLG